uniref:Uncharacterized protein n=1 Tax=Knipowitschia caucasica TaxID=637954 RepID=A0AAV2MEB5_KNICA
MDAILEYRVFNSFYYHIKRRHASYLASGRPPAVTSALVHSGSLGDEHFDIPIFSGCALPMHSTGSVTSNTEADPTTLQANGANEANGASGFNNATLAGTTTGLELL